MIPILFTLVHVLISLVGIVSGLVFLVGLLTGRESNQWTVTFLTTTVLTSVTGFLFPFHGVTPAILLGIISLAVLAIAIYARYSRRLVGAWGRTFVITALLALYFNVFVLIVQSFQKIPALKEIAPTQNDPAFKITQLIVLLLFIGLGIAATVKFRPEPVRAM